jgi:hypothetical protein
VKCVCPLTAPQRRIYVRSSDRALGPTKILLPDAAQVVIKTPQVFERLVSILGFVVIARYLRARARSKKLPFGRSVKTADGRSFPRQSCRWSLNPRAEPLSFFHQSIDLLRIRNKLSSSNRLNLYVAGYSLTAARNTAPAQSVLDFRKHIRLITRIRGTPS